MYIIGYLRNRCAGEILSFTEANGTPVIQAIPGTQGERVYSDNGVEITLTSGAGLDGLKNHTLTYDDQIIRQILECVVVKSKEKIKVVFVGGVEVEQEL